MKKVFRFFALATLVLGTTMFIACGDDEEENNGGNGGNGGGGNNTETGDPVLLDESFESGIPETWVNYDADGDGIGWLSNDLFGGHTGAGIAFSQSYDNNMGPLEPDNYLVTPTIHIPGAGGYNLTFWVCGQDANYAAEHYAVYAGHVENGVFVPSGNALFEETIGSKDQSPWLQKIVNLDAFKGQDIQIAFRHYGCTDMFYLDLDDVKISNE